MALRPGMKRCGAAIREHLGYREKATHHYTLFTLLWRDADAELRPLVEQASQRIAALERNDYVRQ